MESDAKEEGELVIAIPTMGESVSEGTVLEWLKKVGDTVEVDEGIVEISTDKVDAELPSPVAGTLVEILAEPDEVVQAGSVVARIAVGDGAAAPAPAHRSRRPPPARSASPRRRSNRLPPTETPTRRPSPSAWRAPTASTPTS